MPVKEINPISEQQLLAFLLSPHSYPHRPNHVRLKQTHSSYVLLAEPYAYKIKKPVNFAFLDFSTLEQRRYFSEREVILNRRLCPEVHLGVVPISLHADTLAFGPGDEIVGDDSGRPERSVDAAPYGFLQMLSSLCPGQS